MYNLSVHILGKKIFLSFFIIFLVIFQPVIIDAEEENVNIKNELINPGSFYYSFKRLWEKGIEKLQFSQPAKISFSQSQLKTRFAELNYVVEKKLLSEVQTSSERFAYQAGILTDQLVKQNQFEDKEKFLKEFEQYGKFLPSLRDKYPANSSFWMLVQHDINTLNILSEHLK